ncbi:MAG: DUF2203 domain-containing protein, partial [Ardenticatenaceae bacterium]
YFTIEEANALLPTLRKWVKHLMSVHEGILVTRPQMIDILETRFLDCGSPVASRMYVLFLRFEEILRAINRLGVEIKEPGSGLCDFLALHEGREIYLCWRFGEPEVEWWHELHTGFAGRRHVRELR